MTATAELHTDDIKIEQKPPVSMDPHARKGDIVQAQQLPSADYAKELAFNEEPVTIRIEPSAEKNASNVVEAWVNGKGAEIFQNGRWMEITYLPVGRVITVRRKIVEVLARTKKDTLSTPESQMGAPDELNNRVMRFTSGVCSFSIIEDTNPRGAAWLTELRRRNF